MSLLYVQADVSIVTNNMRIRQMQSGPYQKETQLQNDVNVFTAAVCQTRTKTQRHTHMHVRIPMHFQGRESNAPLMWADISSAGNAQIIKGLHREILLICLTVPFSTEYYVLWPNAVTVRSKARVCAFLDY